MDAIPKLPIWYYDGNGNVNLDAPCGHTYTILSPITAMGTTTWTNGWVGISSFEGGSNYAY